MRAIILGWGVFFTLIVCTGNTVVAAELNCSVEASLRSVDYSTPTKVSFVNNTGGPVKTYWLDYQGIRKLYADLPPGQRYVQSTFLTHPWVVTNSAGKCISVFQPEPAPIAAVVGGYSTAHAPQLCPAELMVRSVAGTTPAQMTFINMRQEPISIYWLDYNGTRKLYGTVLPGQSFNQSTYLTHPWVVTRQNSDCLGVYMPDTQPIQVIVYPLPELQTLATIPGSGQICAGPVGPAPCAVIREYLLQLSGREAPPPAPNLKQAAVTKKVEGIGTMCNGPFGPAPCGLVQQYALDRHDPQSYLSSIKSQATDAQQMAVECAKAAKLDTVAFASCTGHRLVLTEQQHAVLDCAVGSQTAQTFAVCAAPHFGVRISDDQRITADCATQSKGGGEAFLKCTASAYTSKDLTPDQKAVLRCARSSKDAAEFTSCSAKHLVGPRLTDQQRVAISCAAKYKDDYKAVAACAGANLGGLSGNQRIVVACAMNSKGETSDFLTCAGSQFINKSLTPDERAVLDCARQSNDTASFASCSAMHFVGPRLSREQQIAVMCTVENKGDYAGTATCAGTNLFNLNLNPEQQIAVQCVVSTGGQPYAAAGCIGTRLTARELTKCFTDGVGGSHGCFGDNNDLFGKNGWTGRTLGDIAGGPHSVFHHPDQIWGGDNSFVRNPGQIWGGSNSFVRNPSTFWGGNNSVFNNPRQLAPKPVRVGTVGGKRVCVPWC
jgi:hypothetical protein